LRQYFPRGTDLSAHSKNALQAVALALNTRPRKTLGWKTPAEAFDESCGRLTCVLRRPVEPMSAALVAVVDDILGSTLTHCHLHGIQHEFGAQVVGHRPSQA